MQDILCVLGGGSGHANGTKRYKSVKCKKEYNSDEILHIQGTSLNVEIFSQTIRNCS